MDGIEILEWDEKGLRYIDFKSCETSPCELSPSKLVRKPYYIFHTWMVSPLCDCACGHCAVLQSWSSCYTGDRGRAWIHCALSRGLPSCKPRQKSWGRKHTWMASSHDACDCAAQNCPDNSVPAIWILKGTKSWYLTLLHTPHLNTSAAFHSADFCLNLNRKYNQSLITHNKVFNTLLCVSKIGW